MNPYVMTTNSGRHIDLMNPDPKQIDINDIALALSKVCRFNGQIKYFYSVAEHSVRVSELLPNNLKLIGLLHDASEAYICDIPTPLKHLLGESYYAIERRIMGAIGEALKVDLTDLPEPVKVADRTMTVTERDYLRAVNNTSWGAEYENSLRYPNFVAWGQHHTTVAERFMKEYNRLKGG